MKLEDPLKQRVVDEAEKQIDEHGYVNIGWFIKNKLKLKVQNTFIKSVAAHMTNSGRYKKAKTGKNEFYIEIDPLGISKRKYNFRTFWLPVIAILIAAISAFITLYLFIKK